MISRTMARRAVAAAGVSLGVALGGGCAGDGLSPRESTHSYADTIYQGRSGSPALDAAAVPTTNPAEPGDAAGPLRVGPALRVTGPISVAVVQIGEVAPPEAAIRAFEDRPDLFARVDPLAGRGTQACQANDDDLATYRAAAANLGDDYLLVYGGTLDDQRVATALSVFDLTIVGCFVVPSEQVTVTGRAAGSLVDVRTGRLAFNVTADASAGTFQPAATASGVGPPLAEAVRRELEEKLVARTQVRLAAARTQRS